MTNEVLAIAAAIKAKVVEIADTLDADARSITDDDLIPATGMLDSAGIFELITWYDLRYAMALKEEEINIDNLGSINKMANFVLKRKSAV
jgi:D-alanine--poly(phosphoribitol) ligase subunit 2